MEGRLRKFVQPKTAHLPSTAWMTLVLWRCHATQKGRHHVVTSDALVEAAAGMAFARDRRASFSLGARAKRNNEFRAAPAATDREFRGSAFAVIRGR